MRTERLDARALNRATLARQFLLARTGAPVLDAVAHLCGLQAQEPQEPFVGLWSRVRGFDPSELSRLLEERAVVRLHLMRRTVHLVAADDAWSWRPRHQVLLRQRILGVYARDLAGLDLDELAAQARALLSDGRPRSLGDIGRELAERHPDRAPRPLGEAVVAALVPAVQLPPRGTWRSTAGARYLPLSEWLGRGAAPEPPDEPDAVGKDLVRRYLGAFGPAASADLRAWCGLAGLPKAVAAVRDELVGFRDDRGRELLDLPDAPRPGPDTPAPVRFLPAFDNAILGYHDRSRIIDHAHRGLSVAGARVVLVDGRVTATWTHNADAIHVTPLRQLTPAERAAVDEEAGHLATFLAHAGHARRASQ
ncbi:winged helix DNA-binding domain-containing protein [Dactylosporangium sp. AC04546]|uniref:winged helix DNA-binding domain-containing protein n=1 Tax=Dactylosporangium sp. AC04546 TaxID=2862460 RepID=UPI001EDD3BE8|nr:winged helix DNA-binding domain-containing protein [Dactylosporangium sp. AC04546]WVK89290.1 winged helix DNA-binding domain-containing protein [Dactylosporangium sp. AC04546]